MDLNQYAAEVHRANRKWWVDITKKCEACYGSGETDMGNDCRICGGTGHPALPKRNVGEMLMLCVTELSEATEGHEDNPERAVLLMQAISSLSRAMEGHRKSRMDDKLPHRTMFEVEIADCVIRLFDIGGGMGLDLEGAYREKMAYNAVRLDHTTAHRLAEGGKKF